MDCVENNNCLDCNKFLKDEINLSSNLKNKRNEDCEIITLKKVKTNLNFGQRDVLVK